MADSQLLHTGEEDRSLVILQSLICLLREKNLLSRGDIEELCEKVQIRATDYAEDPLPCQRETAFSAAAEMSRLGSYIGRRYGGKHRRTM